MKAARDLFRLNLALGLVGLTSAGVIFGALGRAADPTLPSSAALAESCRNLLPQLSVSTWTLAALGLLAAVVIARAVGSLAKRALATRRYLAALETVEDACVAGVRCRVVRDRRMFAFCAGLVCPKVFVSTGAVTSLDRDELEAVVRHEDHHRRRCDPLRLLVTASIAEGLFFSPAVRELSERHDEMCEIAADQHAIDRRGGRAALARAMLTIDSADTTPIGVGISSERVDALFAGSGRRVASGVRPAPVVLTVASVALAALGALALAADATFDPFAAALQSCMALMAVAPLAAIVALLWLSHRKPRKALSD
jgi:beta-lactamase regulating signal transducer with metallopeptidase domain